MKAEVHRKNSSESSDDFASGPILEIITHAEPPERESRLRRTDRRAKHQRSKTDGFVTFTVKDEKNSHSSFRKLYQQGSSDSQENGLLIQQRPSLQSVESEQGTSNFVESGGRRHSNFTNSSLGFLPSSVQVDIKPTGKYFI